VFLHYAVESLKIIYKFLILLILLFRDGVTEYYKIIQLLQLN